MSDLDFTPEWYRNLNKIRDAFQPAISFSDQLKWAREINALKDTFTNPAIERIIRENQWAIDFKDIYKNNALFFNSINSVKKQLDDILFTKTFYNFQSTLTQTLNQISKSAIATRDADLLRNLNDTSTKIADAAAEIENKENATKDDFESCILM